MLICSAPRSQKSNLASSLGQQWRGGSRGGREGPMLALAHLPVSHALRFPFLSRQPPSAHQSPLLDGRAMACFLHPGGPSPWCCCFDLQPPPGRRLPLEEEAHEGIGGGGVEGDWVERVRPQGTREEARSGGAEGGRGAEAAAGSGGGRGEGATGLELAATRDGRVWAERASQDPWIKCGSAGGPRALDGMAGRDCHVSSIGRSKIQTPVRAPWGAAIIP
jgi:hypothetical protein